MDNNENNTNNTNNINETKQNNGNNKKIIAAMAGILAVLLIVWAVISLSSKPENSAENPSGTQTAAAQNNKSDNKQSSQNNKSDSKQDSQTNNQQSNAQTENARPDAKPVFKFFYSASAENAADVMAVVDELKAAYGDKVDFDISDIDAHPEYVEQFSVIAPPQLYMLAKNGDFADMKFGTYDKAELESAIKKTLD